VVNSTRIFHQDGWQNMSKTATLPYSGELRAIFGQWIKDGCRDG